MKWFAGRNFLANYELIRRSEFFGHFGGDSLILNHHFRVPNRRELVVIICSEDMHFQL